MKDFSKWKHSRVCCVLLVLNAAIATAQDKTDRRTPRMEVFSLFSVSRDHPPSGASTGAGVVKPGAQYGFNGGFATNLTRSFDLVIDVGILGGDRDVLSGARADSTAAKEFASTTFFLGGPQYKMRRHHLVEPFVRGLVGGSFRGFTPQHGNAGFAAGLGGGVDLVLSPSVAARIIQYDFLVHTGPNGMTDYHRVSFGVVFRFGGSPESARPADTHK